MDNHEKERDEEKMEQIYSFRMPIVLFKQLKERAGYVPISVVLRRLIEKFVKGEIDLD